MKKTAPMNTDSFRKELLKVMPGFNWTVHRPRILFPGYLCATGVQTSGTNRLATLQVERREFEDGRIRYEVKYSGFGKNAPWLGSYKETTLARGLRGLQNLFEHQARLFSGGASSLQGARKAKIEEV